MAQYSLKDSFVPQLFSDSVVEQSTKTNRFINSGILTPDTQLSGQLTQPGNFITMPFMNDLSGDSDAWSENSDINVNGLTTGHQKMFKLRQSKAFGYTDLSRLVGDGDPMDVIQSRFANWWTRSDQRTVLNMLSGVFSNPKIAKYKVYDDSKNTFSARGFQGAMTLLGDQQDNTTQKILVHPAVYSQMKVNQMIDTSIPQNNAVAPFGTYNGMTIVLDNDAPIDLSTGIATSYVFANNSVKFSVASPDNASEIERESRKQGGRTNIINRRIMTTHVVGTTVADGFTPSGDTATTADLANPSTWDVVTDPSNIKVIAYKAKVDSDFIPAQPQSATTNNSNSNSKSGK